MEKIPKSLDIVSFFDYNSYDETLNQDVKMNKSQNARLVDVAKAAGVSISLASHILNKSSGKNMRVGVETAAKIRMIAEKLGYVPNSAAKALATSRTRCIGYIMSSAFENPWNNEYYGRYLSGAESACRIHGYGLMIGMCSMMTAKNFVMPEHVAQRRVDGLIVIGGIAPELWDVYNSYKIPTVLLDYTPESEKPPYPYVELSERWEFKGLEYARSLGHLQIGICLSAYSSNYDFIFRKLSAAFKKFQKTHNCQIHIFRPPPPFSNWEYDLGSHLYKQWNAVPSAKRPTVLLGGHSLLKYVKDEFQPKGIKIPDDLSIIVSPDFLSHRLFSPSVTSFDIDMEAEGSAAVHALVDHLDNGIPLKTILLERDKHIKLIERESVKRCFGKG